MPAITVDDLTVLDRIPRTRAWATSRAPSGR